MVNNLVLSFATIWQHIIEYINELYEYPIKLISLIIDLAVVLYVLVHVFQLAKNTKVMQLIKGILIIMLITWLSGVLNLTIVHSILMTVLPSGVVALVVIFQPEIRRALEQIGTNNILKLFEMNKDIATRTKEGIYKIVIAVEELAKTKTGALIVLERDIRINDIVATGIEMNADISPQLLVNIFVPKTPLHDGAVIIAGDKIISAACILPLANNKDISKELGTRHRAAIGISRDSDAIAIVVSEESGKISIAKDGTLIADVKAEALKKILIKNIITDRMENKRDKKFTKFNTKSETKGKNNKKV